MRRLIGMRGGVEWECLSVGLWRRGENVFKSRLLIEGLENKGQDRLIVFL